MEIKPFEFADDFLLSLHLRSIIYKTRYQIKHGAKVIKIDATVGVLSFEDPVGAQQLTQAEMEAVVEARKGCWQQCKLAFTQWNMAL